MKKLVSDLTIMDRVKLGAGRVYAIDSIVKLNRGPYAYEVTYKTKGTWHYKKNETVEVFSEDDEI